MQTHYKVNNRQETILKDAKSATLSLYNLAEFISPVWYNGTSLRLGFLFCSTYAELTYASDSSLDINLTLPFARLCVLGSKHEPMSSNAQNAQEQSFFDNLLMPLAFAFFFTVSFLDVIYNSLCIDVIINEAASLYKKADAYVSSYYNPECKKAAPRKGENPKYPRNVTPPSLESSHHSTNKGTHNSMFL